MEEEELIPNHVLVCLEFKNVISLELVTNKNKLFMSDSIQIILSNTKAVRVFIIVNYQHL